LALESQIAPSEVVTEGQQRKSYDQTHGLSLQDLKQDLQYEGQENES